jgi:hypothetical protein
MILIVKTLVKKNLFKMNLKWQKLLKKIIIISHTLGLKFNEIPFKKSHSFKGFQTISTLHLKKI